MNMIKHLIIRIYRNQIVLIKYLKDLVLTEHYFKMIYKDNNNQLKIFIQSQNIVLTVKSFQIIFHFKTKIIVKMFKELIK